MIELRPFQAKGVRTIDHFDGRLLLADEMGLGKTIQALAWLKLHPELRPAVVLCPAHLRWMWKEKATVDFGMRAAVLTGLSPKELNSNYKGVYIVGYDVLTGRTITRGKKVKEYGGWVEQLKSLQPQVIICDECQSLKERSSKRTKSTHYLVQNIPCLLNLSGTPLLSRPAELWPVLNMLWPSEFPNFFAYAMRYCKAKRMPWGAWNFNGASRLPELHRRLSALGMLRRRKVDVLKDLPPKQRTVVPVEINLSEYIQARDNFLEWLRQETPEGADRAAKAEKIAQLGYLKRLTAKEKMPHLIQWIDTYLEGTEDKLAVYGIHKSIVRGLYQRYQRQAVCIDGDTQQERRHGIVAKFQTDPRCRLFFGNIVAAGTGIGLVAAPHLLFAELDWVPGNHTQVEDRIHRIGQTRHTEITYFIAKDTIEEKLCSIIQQKQEIVSAVLDGKRVRDDLDVFSLLTKHLIRESKGLLRKETVG